MAPLPLVPSQKFTIIPAFTFTFAFAFPRPSPFLPSRALLARHLRCFCQPRLTRVAHHTLHIDERARPANTSAMRGGVSTLATLPHLRHGVPFSTSRPREGGQILGRQHLPLSLSPHRCTCAAACLPTWRRGGGEGGCRPRLISIHFRSVQPSSHYTNTAFNPVLLLLHYHTRIPARTDRLPSHLSLHVSRAGNDQSRPAASPPTAANE
mmetsp:Transcript_8226/g.21852  ORF Transcript_8226/g.21852 Transcript_8226/m.21852 type:complete len:209 (-) Transcript_8226:3137-3763(-)